MEQTDQAIITLHDLPLELLKLILSFLNGYKYRYIARRVCKIWMDHLNYWNFNIGYYINEDVEKMANYFSKYTTNLLGLNFAKESIKFLCTRHWEPLSILTNLSSLTFKQAPVDNLDPRFISKLTNLLHLDVPILSKVTLSSLTKLRELDAGVYLSGAYRFYEDLNGYTNYTVILPNLERAKLIGPRYDHYPPSFTSSTRLTKLVLNQFQIMPQNYLASYQNLRILEIRANLERFKEINLEINLPNLEMLTIQNVNINDSWSNLQKLTFLNAYYLTPKDNIKNISLLINLEELIFNCDEMDQVLDLHPLKKLKIVDMLAIDWTNDLITIHEHITLLQCSIQSDKITKLTKFGKLKYLGLKIVKSKNVDCCDLTPLSALQQLDSLSIHDAPMQISLPKLKNLKDLHLTCDYVNGLSSLNGHTGLSIFTKKDDIHHLTNLEALMIQDLDDLSFDQNDIKKLTKLTLTNFTNEKNIITTLTSLRSLTCYSNSWSYNLQQLALQLTALHHLRTLLLNYCNDVASWEDQFTVLTQLHHIAPKPQLKFEEVQKKMPNLCL